MKNFLLVMMVSIIVLSTFVVLTPKASASSTPVKGTALAFDGIDDYVSVPVVNSYVYTFEFWFNATTNSALVGSNRFLIQTSDNTLAVWYDVNQSPLVWNVPIATGVWHHLVVTIDYRDWVVTPYLNGSALGPQSGTTLTKPSLTWITLGSYGNDRYFAGSIDEFRIYNTNMSLSTVAVHYNNGLGYYGRPENGLMQGYHFDEGTGTNAIDYSCQDRNGTIYDATYVIGHVMLPELGDLNGDGKVNIMDLILCSKAFGSKQGDYGWDKYCDCNLDGKVNILDMIIITTSLST